MSHVCTSIGPKVTGRRQTGSQPVGGGRVVRHGAGAGAELLEGRLLFAVGFTPLVEGDFNADGTGDEVVFARARRARRILAASGSEQLSPSLFVIDGVSSATVLGALLPLGAGRGTPLATAGDVNGDGRADLVVANRSGRRGLDVLLNDGSGGFGAASPITNAPVGISSLDLADFDGDGRADLVVTTDGGGVGRGRGSINQFRAFIGPSTAAGVSAEAGGATGLAGSFFAGDADREPTWTPLGGGAGSGGSAITWGDDLGGGAGARASSFVGAPGASEEAGGGVGPAGLPNLFFDGGRGSAGGVVVLLGNGDGTFQDASLVGGSDLGFGPRWTELESGGKD